MKPCMVARVGGRNRGQAARPGVAREARTADAVLADLSDLALGVGAAGAGFAEGHDGLLRGLAAQGGGEEGLVAGEALAQGVFAVLREAFHVRAAGTGATINVSA